MNDREFRKTIAAMKRVAAKAKKDPAYALDFLIKAGIVTKGGKLKKPYRSDKNEGN